MRNNRLLEATVGDLRDELKSAQEALKSKGEANRVCVAVIHFGLQGLMNMKPWLREIGRGQTSS